MAKRTPKQTEQVTEVKAIPFAATIEREVEASVLAKMGPAIHEAIQAGVQQALAKALQAPHGRIVTREQRNEVKRPKEGGRCDAVWRALDEMRARGKTTDLHNIIELAKERKWNTNNARVEFYQWRRFNGMTTPRGAASVQASSAVANSVQANRRSADRRASA